MAPPIRPEYTTVAAWIRMRIRPPPQPMMLTRGGPAPPAEPPLPEMTFRPVPTDPRPRFFTVEEETEDGTVAVTWNAEEPEHLVAELRVPSGGRHAAPETVARFWEAVRRRVAPLAPVEVEGSDPPPPARAGR